MSIEIGSKWVKDREVVEVLREGIAYIGKNDREDMSKLPAVILFKDKEKEFHILTERDFLEQYKPCEPVYEYRYVTDIYCETKILNRYFTEDEIKEEYEVYQRIDFTKRERK